MKEEFNLSDEIINGFDMLPVEDVKKFIKRLKELAKLELQDAKMLIRINLIIDKLAGEEFKWESLKITKKRKKLTLT